MPSPFSFLTLDAGCWIVAEERDSSGRTGSLRTRSSHTTVRTVPYTAVQNESDGGPLVGLKKTEEAEFVEMAV